MDPQLLDFIPLTPVTIQILRELEVQKQATLRAVIAQAGVTGGNWEMANDGSGLLRRDAPAQSPQKIAKTIAKDSSVEP